MTSHVEIRSGTLSCVRFLCPPEAMRHQLCAEFGARAVEPDSSCSVPFVTVQFETVLPPRHASYVGRGACVDGNTLYAKEGAGWLRMDIPALFEGAGAYRIVADPRADLTRMLGYLI